MSRHRQLEVLVTSGGTAVPIDNVRRIDNFSTGETGASIAEEFLKAGARVHFLYRKGSKRPFRKELVINDWIVCAPDDEAEFLLDDEIDTIRSIYADVRNFTPNLEEREYTTFDEYMGLVKKIVLEEDLDAAVLAAAVSDFGADKVKGKISSDQDSLSLDLKPLPKVISMVKTWSPRVFQVGFKWLEDVSFDELIDTAYRHGIKNRSNLTVANGIVKENPDQRTAVLITPEKGLVPVPISDLAARLVETVVVRQSGKHYHTVDAVDQKVGKTMGESGPSNAGLIIDSTRAQLREDIRYLWDLALFEPHFKGSSAHFGFVARRLPGEGFLITARASDKRAVPSEDIVEVSRVDRVNRIVYCRQGGKKPSLNANVAGEIFSKRPDVDLIVHAHVFPGVPQQASCDYAPSTQEDVNEVMGTMWNGEGTLWDSEGGQFGYGKRIGWHNIIELPNHGIIATGSSVKDIVGLLDKEPAYTRFPEMYDVVYARFLDSPDLIDLVKKTVSPDARILDLAAGTGKCALELCRSGYWNVVMADKNKGMLEVAMKKCAKEGFNVPAEIADMTTFEARKKYDAIFVRQAINYMMDPDGLQMMMSRAHAALDAGGALFFNAPNFQGVNPSPSRDSEYESSGYRVRVYEMNRLDGRVLTHAQRCELVKSDCSGIRKVYDLNRFAMYTKDEFDRALRDAGFSSVSWQGDGLAELTSLSKGMHCVARK